MPDRRTLHTVNKSPFERDALASCLRVARAGSTVLLIEDGVYAALDGAQDPASIEQAMERLAIAALSPDLAARGLDTGRVRAGIVLVDYAGFVTLAATHDNVQSWL